MYFISKILLFKVNDIMHIYHMQLKCQVMLCKWEKNIGKETHYSTRDFCTLDVLDLKPLKMLFLL